MKKKKTTKTKKAAKATSVSQTALRNQFAAASLAGILSDPTVRRGNWVDGFQWPEDYDTFCDTVAHSAFRYADAMVARSLGGAS